MKSRKEIVENWLPRYTGVPLKDFGEYILLTNFQRYVKLFAQWHRVPVAGRDMPMPSATGKSMLTRRCVRSRSALEKNGPHENRITGSVRTQEAQRSNCSISALKSPGRAT